MRIVSIGGRCAALVCCALLAGSSAPAAVVESPSMAIHFAEAGQGFAITGIVNKVAGGARFVDASGKKADFWSLRFTGGGKAGESITLQNHNPSSRRIRRRADGGADFEWRGLDLPGANGAVDVFASVALTPDGASEWTIAVSNRAANGWALADVSYPCLRDAIPPGEGDALVPSKNLGARFVRGFDQRTISPNFYGYPGWYTMVTAFHRGDAGLYFAAHDREARIKTLRYDKDGVTYFETPVEDSGVPGKAAEGPRYPVVIAAYRGDWWTAARMYRKFAMTCPWTAKGPIARRTDYPKAMADTSVWGLLGYDVDDATNRTEWIRSRWPDLKIGLHWYNWNVQPARGTDALYPEFFAWPGVAEHFSRCKGRGLMPMPYLNGRIWDMQLRSFAYAKADACHAADGSVQIERYGHGFAVMCPTRPTWQNVLLEMGTNAVEGLGAPAVYYDQVACSRPQLCFDRSHGHPAGGGGWWADGYRTAFARLHDRLAPLGVPITSEGAAETWLDVIDGHLICGRAASPDDVPFLPAVYSGYTVYFGMINTSKGNFDSFFANVARATLWGCATGRWGYTRYFKKDTKYPGAQRLADREADVIASCARVRVAASEFLVEGHLEDELRPLDLIPKTPVEWHSPVRPRPGKPPVPPVSVETPVVVGVAWRNAEDSRKAFFAVNISGERQTVRFALPRGCGAAETMPLPDQAKPSLSVAGAVASLSVEPKSIACVVVDVAGGCAAVRDRR